MKWILKNKNKLKMQIIRMRFFLLVGWLRPRLVLLMVQTSNKIHKMLLLVIQRIDPNRSKELSWGWSPMLFNRQSNLHTFNVLRFDLAEIIIIFFLLLFHLRSLTFGETDLMPHIVMSKFPERFGRYVG